MREENLVKQEPRAAASRVPNRRLTNEGQPANPERPTRGSVKQAPPLTDPGRQAGEKLLETDLYELYGKTNYLGDWCFQDYEAGVVQVFKVGAEFIIKNDDVYEERFEREILPILKARCKALKRVDIKHYIKGVRIDSQMNEHGDDESFSGAEQPLSMMTIMINPKGALTYTVFREESLAALRAKREALPQQMAKDEEFRNRWKKRAEESTAQRRAAEEAAEQKLAEATVTADGQLSLSGIDNEHKRLFLMIYEGRHVELSKRSEIQDLPIILYRNAMSRYDKLCHKSFSDRIRVEETVEVFDHQEWNPLTRTMTTVTKKITDTSYMERRYEQAFRSTFGKNITAALKHSQKDVNERVTRRPGLWDNILNKGAVMLEEAQKERERIEKANASLQVLLSPEACGKPGIVRFVDNLNRHVTHDYSSDAHEHAKPVNGSYPYTEKIGGESGLSAFIERTYEGVPPTFSPDFPVPADGEEIFIWVNKDSERKALRSVMVSTLSLRDLTPDRTFTKIKLPADVQQALEEKKYFVVQCEYLHGPGVDLRYYWNANGPLPSESVQTFAKNTISGARTSCPVKPSNP